jgi:hypothetical protein
MSDMNDAPERPIVLVVEDEPLVRMLAADILEEAEMEVVEASTAPAALLSWNVGTTSLPYSPTSTCRAGWTAWNWPASFTHDGRTSLLRQG